MVKNTSSQQPQGRWTPDDILKVLDRGAEDFVFPMLDNGYVYLAATRMSLHRSDDDWALVFEVFGFSPRSGFPDLCVCTFGSRLRDRDSSEQYVSRAAYENYLAQHPNDDSRFFFPIAEGEWQDPELDEFVSANATEVLLRDEPIRIPPLDELAQFGIDVSEPPQMMVFELCRFLAAQHRDRVLATPDERRVSVPDDVPEILKLDDWTHPDLADSVLPSECETFVQLAQALASGDTSRYRPATSPNTHWRNWPDGGSL